jgi:hypothetical protein
LLARGVNAATLGQRFGAHAQRTVFEVLIIWFGHDVAIFLVKKTATKPKANQPLAASRGVV